MMLRGYYPFKIVITVACAFLLLPAFAHQAAADSFASLNMFGFPATGGGLSGISDITSNAGALSASSASYSPPGQFTGFFGTGLDGIQIGMDFAYPMASHDASTVAYSRNIAFESVLGDDSISFPEINVDMGSSWSGFPTINSASSNVKYMESVQFMLSTESDTMPVTGYSFPGFFGSWL